MENLSTPSRALASRVVQEVNFEDRLIGSILHLRAGIRIVSLYSLEELFMLLKEPYPQIDVAQLENWIRTIIHDEELADRIKSVTLQKAGDKDTVHSIRDLVGWRLIQCKHVTG
jgi:hypothetical protein